MNWKFFFKDLSASIVVFFVALPLCLGIALASGQPPALGLISGIIGGVIVGFFAGCPLQVSGPAAGLIALNWEIIQNYGVENLGIFVLAAGLLQIMFGLLKFGPWFQVVSPAVIHGMLSGIGVLIFASQFHVMVDDKPRSSALANLLSIPDSFMKGVMIDGNSPHHLAAVIGVLTILTMLIWNFLPKFFRVIPSPLAGVLLAIGITQYLHLPINYVSVPSNPFEGIVLPSIDSFKLLLDFDGLSTALTVAFIATAETMLTAKAVDQMHSGPRTRYNREVIAQGIGNSVAGLLGAIPITAVIVRSSANVKFGAQTKNAAIMHGLWLLLTVLFFAKFIQMIPTACLAAILVYTSTKLIDIKEVKELAEYGKSELFIYGTTLLLIVFTNILFGVLVGVVMTGIKILKDLSTLKIETDENFNVFMYGSATFISIPEMISRLNKLPMKKDIHIHVNELDFIDPSSFEQLLDWEQQYIASGGSVHIEWEELESKVISAPKNKAK